MAREWAVVLETVSRSAAKRLGAELTDRRIDVDVESSAARVWCYGTTREEALAAFDIATRFADRQVEPLLQGPAMLRVWNEQRTRYVDPDHRNEDPDTGDVWIDSEIEPEDVRWRVRLELDTVFEFRRVRRQLPALSRPVIDTGNKHIDLGVTDAADASDVAVRATAFEGVASAHPSEIRGGLRRWLVRQRLAGNYGTDLDGAGYGYDFGGWGGGDGGGGGGGDGGGGGGH